MPSPKNVQVQSKIICLTKNQKDLQLNEKRQSDDNTEIFVILTSDRDVRLM